MNSSWKVAASRATKTVRPDQHHGGAGVDVLLAGVEGDVVDAEPEHADRLDRDPLAASRSGRRGPAPPRRGRSADEEPTGDKSRGEGAGQMADRHERRSQSEGSRRRPPPAAGGAVEPGGSGAAGVLGAGGRSHRLSLGTAPRGSELPNRRSAVVRHGACTSPRVRRRWSRCSMETSRSHGRQHRWRRPDLLSALPGGQAVVLRGHGGQLNRGGDPSRRLLAFRQQGTQGTSTKVTPCARSSPRGASSKTP